MVVVILYSVELELEVSSLVVAAGQGHACFVGAWLLSLLDLFNYHEDIFLEQHLL